MLFLRRRLRSRLDLVKPDVAATVERAQEGQRECRALVAKDRTFAVGDAVLVRDYRRGEEKWMPGQVTSQEGPVSYTVDVGAGVRWRRHTEQMQVGDHALLVPTNLQQPALLNQSSTVSGRDSSPSSPEREDALCSDTVNPEQEVASTAEGLVESGRRYPLRVVKPPDRLNL